MSMGRQEADILHGHCGLAVAVCNNNNNNNNNNTYTNVFVNCGHAPPFQLNILLNITSIFSGTRRFKFD